ncbi:MAG: hypothetical protein V3S40_01285 [Kiloniellales bacterium]
MTGSPPDIEALDLDGLKRLVLQLLEEVASLKVENAALREEIARLKGLKGRPKLAPSGMEEARARRSLRARAAAATCWPSITRAK